MGINHGACAHGGLIEIDGSLRFTDSPYILVEWTIHPSERFATRKWDCLSVLLPAIYLPLDSIRSGELLHEQRSYSMGCSHLGNRECADHNIGWFYDDKKVILDKVPIDFKKHPLQQTASEILGLPYLEIKPKIKERKLHIDPNLKQVCIGVFGTAQSKFWNNPTGWQDVVDWLNNKGYTVKLVSKEGDDYMGNKLPKGIIHHPNGPIERVMDEMLKSKAFIGIGSGLSWLSWSLNVPTVLISGFSYDWAEMTDCYRISAPKGKCEGCFNRLRLNASDWNWCPDHKGTERQFECTKSITSEMVIKELEKFL